MRRATRLRAKRGGKGRDPDGGECDPSCDAAAAAADPAAPPTAPTPSAPQPPLPPPPAQPPPEEENQPGPSGDRETESGTSGEEPPKKERSGENIGFFRGLQQSLGRQLPGGACGMKKGGGGGGGGGKRRSKGEWAKQERLSQCRDWLRATLKETGLFMTRADSRIWLTLAMAAAAGLVHWYYLTCLFEHDRHFSHLSSLEREMSFRTEMGLYYSYFKTMVEAPSFWNGLCMIMNDRLIEYPLVINTLKRFNVYPEVVLAFWYRFCNRTMDILGIEATSCWTVNRGEGLSPVNTCEGLGDPSSFYVAMIFLLNGVMVSGFFIYGTYLSGSRFGGMLTVSCFFFNHGESTRVMWTPPLRESFSYPFLVVQMLLLTYILRAQTVNRGSLIALSIANVFFMLPWQFAQFVLLTQVMSVFAIYVLGFIDACKLRKILYAHMASLFVCFILMFGNAMLLTSYYAASLAVCWGILEVCPKYLKMCRNDIYLWAVEGVSFLLGTVIWKSLMCLIFGISDDAHISNLLKAKLLGYRDFDTAMYLCAAEFGFMEKETPIRYAKTLLLPLVLFIFLAIVKMAFQHVVSSKKSTQRQVAAFKQGEMVYLAVQLISFTILAVLIMRLKLFLTPHMCIMASLIFSKQLFGWLFCKFQPGVLAVAIFAVMAYEGSANINKEWNITGEFNNFPQEELLLWIKAHTKKDAVFAGAMPTMASVKLSALRPVVNHPHYENADLRARTKIVYSMFSRKPAREVKNELLKLGVNYYILEDSWCSRNSGPGCSLPEIWDLEDLANAGKTPLCTLMKKDPRPYFRPVFSNSMFKVLEVTRE